MPKINITEVDYSTAPSEYANFSVVIPGLVSNSAQDVFDANGIYECSKLSDFEENVGIVVPVATKVGSVSVVHYGNQMAYECIKAGLTVLYFNIGKTVSEAMQKINTDGAFDALKDKSEYDFRFIVTGLAQANEKANKAIMAVAEERGDCVAICDLDENLYTADTIKSASELTTALIKNVNDYTGNKYTAFCVPSLCYELTDSPYETTSETSENIQNKFPAAMHYLLCAANNKANNIDEWFANAGETRGKCEYDIKSTSIKIGERLMNELEPRKTDGGTDDIKFAVNPIVTFRNRHYLWGNRTAYPLNENNLLFSHFLNIRQLCSTLKKQIYVTCKHLMFDPNSDVLWTNFCEAIRPTLEKMKANQGIVDYRFVKCATKEKGKLVARVRIIPIEAVEDFDIEVALEEEFGAASATIKE